MHTSRSFFVVLLMATPLLAVNIPRVLSTVTCDDCTDGYLPGQNGESVPAKVKWCQKCYNSLGHHCALKFSIACDAPVDSNV